MILGYTRGGCKVLLPTRQDPDMGPFVDWTPGDHLDAARILMEHGERSPDPLESWCSHWAPAHWELGKHARRKRQKSCASVVRGAAETKIIIGRRRR